MASEIPREKLLDALQAFAAELDETPTRKQMNETGPYSSSPYYSEWGSWNEALAAAGLTTNHRTDISNDELCAELQRVKEQLGRLPRFEDMDDHGEFSPHTYSRRFGSWETAKEEAGLAKETRTSRRIPERALVAALWDLRDEIGRTPTQQDMNDLGDFSQRPYYRAFDSWATALEAAGFEPNHENEIAKGRLIEGLQELAEELGRPPMQREIREQGEFSPEPYYRAFGSLPAAKEAAGLDTTEVRPSGRVPRQELLMAIEELAAEVDGTPTKTEMRMHGRYSKEPYQREFGSWNGALEAAGFEPHKEHDVSDERLLDELRSLTDDIGRTPTQAEMIEEGAYYPTTYDVRFGTWNKAIEKAGLDVIHEVGVAGGTIQYGPNWPEQREKRLGKDDWECQGCGMTNTEHEKVDGQGLHVHHRTKRRKFEDYEEANRVENLVSLCRECHVEWEKR